MNITSKNNDQLYRVKKIWSFPNLEDAGEAKLALTNELVSLLVGHSYFTSNVVTYGKDFDTYETYYRKTTFRSLKAKNNLSSIVDNASGKYLYNNNFITFEYNETYMKPNFWLRSTPLIQINIGAKYRPVPSENGTCSKLKVVVKPNFLTSKEIMQDSFVKIMIAGCLDQFDYQPKEIMEKVA
jgi:hypothetical protein